MTAFGTFGIEQKQELTVIARRFIEGLIMPESPNEESVYLHELSRALGAVLKKHENGIIVRLPGQQDFFDEVPEEPKSQNPRFRGGH